MPLNDPIYFDSLDWGVVVRLGIAALIGLALGLDRELRGHSAGLRTHGLICFSSAAMTVSIIALYSQLGGVRMDPLRIFEATGAFVGIIGAGLIVFSKGKVKNVTTAAHLWLAAVIGIACGAGQYPLVLVGGLMAVLLLTVVGLAERKWFPHDRERT